MTFDATDLHLREAYSQYGEITSINIGRDGRGLSRGYVIQPDITSLPSPECFQLMSVSLP